LARPTTKRRKIVHRNLPEYLHGPAEPAPGGAPAALAARPVSAAPSATRQHQGRDFRHVKSDLVRIFVISVFLCLVLAALTLVLA
jgi:hypothetical protein